MTLTTWPIDPVLDVLPHVGQRVETFTYKWINGVTNEPLGWVHPERAQPPVLSHDTTQSIKRRLGINLNVAETGPINAITDRILPYVTIAGVTWPLGRYMFTDETDLRSTAGERGRFTLVDEGFIIDQQFDEAFSSTDSVTNAVFDLLTGLLNIDVHVDASPYGAVGAFSAGQTRGQALSAYETQGDFFPYWMDHTGRMRMIRTKDPAKSVVDLDFDVGRKVRRDPEPAFTSDVLTAPNRFVVISNSGEAGDSPIVGVYDVPPSAPHSIARRGFVIPDVRDMQLKDPTQAAAVAQGIGIRNTIFERVTLSTSIDPRHDSYNVIRYDGMNWLELAWSMTLAPGGDMQHTMRKAYV